MEQKNVGSTPHISPTVARSAMMNLPLAFYAVNRGPR
jgi:hypothetical protein